MQEYIDETTNSSKCQYHPGVAIFHEGMKYWSCCERKTSDFDNFLNQEGCTIGVHLWFKKQVIHSELFKNSKNEQMVTELRRMNYI